MKFWLSKNSGISLRDQLTCQIKLAIISGDFESGSRLPSVRALAQRYKIHANTASSAYRWLEENNWVETRVGSGVFVRDISPTQIAEAALNIENDLDEMIRSFLKEAAQLGFSRQQIKSRLNTQLKRPTPRKIVILEKNRDLSRILIEELSEYFSLPISSKETEAEKMPKNSLIVSLIDLNEKAFASPMFIQLKLNSVQNSMINQTRPGETDLIGIASHWEIFRQRAQTMLVAAGIAEENLVIRNPNENNWQNGLKSCKFVVTDSLTAKQCKNLKDIRVFRLISDDSIEEIKILLA